MCVSVLCVVRVRVCMRVCVYVCVCVRARSVRVSDAKVVACALASVCLLFAVSFPLSGDRAHTGLSVSLGIATDMSVG